MADRQEPTITDRNYLFQSLDQQYQDAILMHFDGIRYKQIAKELNVKYGTVRDWFMKGGICCAAFQELLDIRSKENKKKAKKIEKKFEEYAPDALETLYESAKAGNWKAAESLLDRAGYSPVQKIKTETDNGDLDKVAEAIDKLSEYAKSTIDTSDKNTA